MFITLRRRTVRHLNRPVDASTDVAVENVRRDLALAGTARVRRAWI